MRPIICLLPPLFFASMALADASPSPSPPSPSPPPAAPAVSTAGTAGASTEETPWGARTQDLQSRLIVTAPLSKGGPVSLTAQIRNVSDQPIPLLNVRVWFMVAQGPEHVVYSAPAEGPKKETLEGGAQMEIRVDAAALAAYRYVPTLVIRNGVPVAPPAVDKSAPPLRAPERLGHLTDFLPVGPIKIKAFVLATIPVTLSMQEHVSIIPSASVAAAVGEATIAAMAPAQQQATFDEIATLFCADAVSGKNGHDRAVSIGKPIIPRLVQLLSDDAVTDPGRMWLTATIIDLHDSHTVEALTSILNKGGSGAYVVAYMGPKMHDAALTAAITHAARSTKDAMLTAWAARGLGVAGEPIDSGMLEPMVTHSDAAGRAEAADILAADGDAHALPLLARLIGDEDVAVRLHAAKAAADHNLGSPSIVKALEAMAHRADSPSQAAANDALNRMTTK